MEGDAPSDDTLSGFTEPVAYDSDHVKEAEEKEGVHVVWNRDGDLIYVGRSSKQRTRLRQHLNGDRGASVLHKQVGDLLDRLLEREATKEEIRSWLGSSTVAWKYDPNRRRSKLG